MKKAIFAIAIGAAVVSTPALAQGYGGGRDQTRAEAQQRADMMFQMMDSNKDGTVTKAEAEQALAQFQAMRGGDDNNARGGGRMQRMMDQAFATSQSLTQAQFEAQALARFDAMDLNHDGTVTAAERQQARAQMRANAAPSAAPAPAPQAQPQPQ
jgi:Ca2+-binding EF-hand superfamily protein